MAPSRITPPQTPQTTDELTESGVNHTVNDTATSILSKMATSSLQELDASKLTFTRNPDPKAVPIRGSAEEAGMAV